jgi:hypothetical protein
MKLALILSLRVAGFPFTGCATSFRAPSDVAHLKLKRVSSPGVAFEKIWLERKKGPLVVTGYVVKRLEAEDTTQTHLDVTLCDGAGHVLRGSAEHFAPRQIPRRFRLAGSATYRVPLDPLPADTALVELRAQGEPTKLWTRLMARIRTLGSFATSLDALLGISEECQVRGWTVADVRLKRRLCSPDMSAGGNGSSNPSKPRHPNLA